MGGGSHRALPCSSKVGPVSHDSFAECLLLLWEIVWKLKRNIIILFAAKYEHTAPLPAYMIYRKRHLSGKDLRTRTPDHRNDRPSPTAVYCAETRMDGAGIHKSRRGIQNLKRNKTMGTNMSHSSEFELYLKVHPDLIFQSILPPRNLFVRPLHWGLALYTC